MFTGFILLIMAFLYSGCSSTDGISSQDDYYIFQGIEQMHNKGEYDLALADYNKAIELYQPNLYHDDARLVFAYYNKGNVLTQLGINNEAIECFKRLIQHATSGDELREKAKQNIIKLGGAILIFG